MITYVRKPPNVSQVHRKTNDRQEKVHLFAPFVPGVRLRNDRRRGRAVGVVCGVRGAVVGRTAGHDCGVLSGHRTVKSHAEDQRGCVSCGEDRRRSGRSCTGHWGHLLAEAHYARIVPTQFGVQMKESRKQLLESAFLLLCPVIEQDFQIHFRRFQRIFNEICQCSFAAVLDFDKWEGFCRMHAALLVFPQTQ